MNINAEKAREITKQARDAFRKEIENTANSCIQDIIEPAIQEAAEKRFRYAIIFKKKIFQYGTDILEKVLAILRENNFSVTADDEDEILIEW